MTIYKLYLKIHKKTGLRYLGQTKSDDPYLYKGSGVDWNKHLTEHGNIVETIILLETECRKEISVQGRYYSKLWRVTTAVDDYGNRIYANRIPETGGGDSELVSISKRGTKCWTNGIIEKYSKTCPGPDFILGTCRDRAVYGLIGAEKSKNMKWISNGIEDIVIMRDDPIPIGYTSGRKLHSRTMGKMIWWNDGINEVMDVVAPSEEWFKGRLSGRGGSNGRARKLQVNGIVYNSIVEAATALGVTVATIRNSIKGKYRSKKIWESFYMD